MNYTADIGPQINKQTDKQMELNILLTPTDSLGVGNKLIVSRQSVLLRFKL